jgi:hypothetical protein
VIECARKSCKARTRNGTPICRDCEHYIRNLLELRPWWLSRLTETALGQVRMSSNGGRRSAPRAGIDGDKPAAAYIETMPGCRCKCDCEPAECEHECQCDPEKARRRRERAAMAHALAGGRVNARASELLAEQADALQFWCRELCEARGLPYIPLRFRGRQFIGPLQTHEVRRAKPTTLGADHAIWLSEHFGAIRASEHIGDILADIERQQDEIETAVNRPIRWRFVGECPTYSDEKRTICGVELRAPEDHIEVTCPKCRTMYNINRLQVAFRAEFERRPQPWREVLSFNADSPPEFQIALSTLKRWRKDGELPVRGWLRPDGNRGIARHGDDDVPLYLWSDVQQLVIGRNRRSKMTAAERSDLARRAARKRWADTPV